MHFLRTKRIYLGGFAGLMGLIGFKYFFTGDTGDLFFFTMFALFSLFLIAPFGHEMPDERFMENSHRAGNKVFPIPTLLIGIVGFLIAYDFGSQELLTILCVGGFVATSFCYAIAFRYYESK